MANANIEGNYWVRLQRKDDGEDLNAYGKMELYLDGEQLKGVMFPTFFWLESFFRGGKADDNGNFEFTVFFATPCQQWVSDVKGCVKENRVTGSMSTPAGDYQLSGTRISCSAHAV
ncbi:hypothetical protein LQZ18_05415 [Lachnospiraceae bacterium ZAX-1]